MGFQKGQSGNPGGRPSPARQELAALLDKHYRPRDRRHSIERLVALQDHADPDVALDAIRLLLAYAYGRPTERKELSGPEGSPLPVQVFDYAAAIAAVAAGPGEDRAPPGADAGAGDGP